MFRKVLLTIGLLLAAHVAAIAQGSVRGDITDEKNGEPLIGANVVLKDHETNALVTGARTDYNGSYNMKGVQVGKYYIEVSYMGYVTVRTEIDVKASGFTVFNQSLGKSAGGTQLEAVKVVATKVPVIDIGAPESGTRLSADDISRMPSNSVEGIVAAVAGVGFDDGGTGSARGEGNMVTQVGNVRTRTGVNVPKEAIAEIQVVLGGTPASIGEAIGGTQIITLKPPSTKMFGIAKYETYLDYRLYNRLDLYLTGPLVKIPIKNDKGEVTGERPFIGYRFTGTGAYTKWSTYRPKDGRLLVVDDDKVKYIEENPLRYDPINGTINYEAEYLRESDFVTIKRPNGRNYFTSHDAPNFGSYSINLQGALDFRFTDLTSLVLTAEYDYSYGHNTQRSFFPLNLHNQANGVYKTHNFVITADFTQRFADPETVTSETNPDEKIEPAVSRVMYNITAMYNRYSQKNYNEQFGDNVFKYGHVGTFERTQSPHYTVVNDYNYRGTIQTAHVQDSWIENVDMSKFEPSPYNPLLANYNTWLMNQPQLAGYLTSFDNILELKGLRNGDAPDPIYSTFNNVGSQVSSYSKAENNYYYVSAKAAATVKGHDLEIGFQYDQYTSRSYGLSAYSLWTLMRNNANAHIIQLSTTPLREYFLNSELYVDFERLPGIQTTFDSTLRVHVFGDYSDKTWINVDGISPEDYYERFGGMNMFSADELFNNGNQYVSYYGYDHTGARYRSNSWNLDDFFDPVGSGHPTKQFLPVFSPIYAAGYVQDKFYFSDLIFNVGVRVDYYDGNQMVLKDPYLLYDSYTKARLVSGEDGADYNTGFGATGHDFPSIVGDDWVVYVDDYSTGDDGTRVPTVRGYRNGSTWYNASGVEVSTPNAISGESGKPTPYRTKESMEVNSSGNYVKASAFKDYDPQVIVQPRIAFSFPVNDMSQFKANYDIIARRPSSGWQADYFSYLFMTQQTSAINNPNLKPERITNYELGFQQALNEAKTAAISLSAYYKETRDLIQLVQYAGADPNSSYYSYDNLDFKTTKGFSLAFDMRQSNNVRINANYTLQYAEETYLSATTMSELIKEGYTTLKMLNPISDDRRHEFKANVDYRLGKGEGWKITRAVKDKDGNLTKKDIYPFENFGINFLAVAQSGIPYTRQFSNTQSTIVGSYRGARLPWGFYFNVVVDKTWPIEIKREGKKTKPTALNAAVTINNLFDIRNVVNVFGVTGNPSDNGYLTDPETQSVINSYLDPQSYRDMYTIMLNNNYWNWSSPRTIRVTLTYQF